MNNSTTQDFHPTPAVVNGQNPIVLEVQQICNALQGIHYAHASGILTDAEKEIARQILIGQLPTEEVLQKREAKLKADIKALKTETLKSMTNNLAS